MYVQLHISKTQYRAVCAVQHNALQCGSPILGDTESSDEVVVVGQQEYDEVHLLGYGDEGLGGCSVHALEGQSRESRAGQIVLLEWGLSIRYDKSFVGHSGLCRIR